MVALSVIGGFDVKCCENGVVALREAEAFAPDLMVLDVMMPEMDGPETLKHLQKIPSLRTKPVVFLTAKVHPEEVARLRQLGATGVLPKPFDPMTLSAQLREIWEKAI